MSEFKEYVVTVKNKSDVDSFYDERNKMFTPLFIKFKNGWINDTSKNHCYCPRTLTEFIFDLYPEYIPSE